MSTSIPTAMAVGAATSAFSSSTSSLSPEERLLALVVYTQTSNMNEAKTSVNLNAEQLEKLRDEVKKALEEAREAKKDSGFWGGLAELFGSDLASIASAVAAVAVVVATGGAAAAIIAVVAAAATMAADHAEALGIPVEVAMGIAIAASVASLCCGDGKALFKVSAAVKDVAKDAKLAAQLTQVGFQLEGAGCGAVAASSERDASYAQANARLAEGRQGLVSMDIDEALDRFAAAVDQQSTALKWSSGMAQQNSVTSHALLGNWGGTA